MRQFVKTAIAPLLAVLFLAACSNGNVSKEKESNVADSSGQEKGMAIDATVTDQSERIQLKDDKLNAIYEQYNHLTSAVVKGDVKGARLAGNAIETGARSLSGGEKIALNAAKIAATADLETLRIAFSALSNDLIVLTKKSGLDKGRLYIDFCPMAMNGKGAYWLSRDKAMQNPYFGEKMLTCGEVKGTIQ